MTDSEYKMWETRLMQDIVSAKNAIHTDDVVGLVGIIDGWSMEDRQKVEGWPHGREVIAAFTAMPIEQKEDARAELVD